MADAYGTVPINIRLDGDGALPLPTYATFGSTRHVANSTIDVSQYTGVGAATLPLDLVVEREDYDDLIDIYRGIPRVAHTLTIGDDDWGQWFIDSISAPRLMLTGEVFVAVALKEAP